MASKIVNMRVNPKTEADIYAFIMSKGGLKKAFNHLYQHYLMTQRIDDIVDRLSSQIEFIPKQNDNQVNPDKEAALLLNNFLK